MITIGPYRVHLDALAARIIYRWRVQAIFVFVILLIGVPLLTGAIPPFWRGTAALSLSGPAGAALRIDGRPWPQTVYAGTHRVQAQHGERVSWADVTLLRTIPFTVTLPLGLLATTRTLPPPAPGLQLGHVWPADGGWRAVASAPPLPTPANGGPLPTATTAPQTIALHGDRAERLGLLDAYAGLADTVTTDGQTFAAQYAPVTQRVSASDPSGSLTIRGWSGRTTVSLSETLTLVRFVPDGQALLLGTATAAGTQLRLLRPSTDTQTPVLAVPGTIARLTWAADSGALVVASTAQQRLTLTLVRLRPTLAAAVIADLAVSDVPDAIVPLAWTATGVTWVVPDGVRRARWHADLATLLPTLVGSSEARALTVLPAQSIREVRSVAGRLVVLHSDGDQDYGEAVIADVPVTPDLVGIWQGNTLLLRSVAGVWLVEFKE